MLRPGQSPFCMDNSITHLASTSDAKNICSPSDSDLAGNDSDTERERETDGEVGADVYRHTSASMASALRQAEMTLAESAAALAREVRARAAERAGRVRAERALREAELRVNLHPEPYTLIPKPLTLNPKP